jgi:hypothetical protein
MEAASGPVSKVLAPMSTRNCQVYVPFGIVKAVAPAEHTNPLPPPEHPLSLSPVLICALVPQPVGEVITEALSTLFATLKAMWLRSPKVEDMPDVLTV